MTTPRLPRDDIAAAMAARRELGPEYDDAFVDAVVARLQESLETRPAPPPAPAGKARPAHSGDGGRSGAFVVVFSLLVAMPLTAIAGETAGLPGLIAAWVGLVLINLGHSQRKF